MNKLKTIIVTLAVFAMVFSIGPVVGNSDAESEGGIPDGTEVGKLTVATSNGVLKKFRSVTSDSMFHSTTSTTLVQVPDMSTTFNTARKGTMVITYSAFVWAQNMSNNMKVVAQVDGVNATPGEVIFVGDSNASAQSHTFTWVAPNVPAGGHTVRIMWRSLSSNTVWTHKRTMIVQYKR